MPAVRVDVTPKFFRTLADKIEAGELKVHDYISAPVAPRKHTVCFDMEVMDTYQAPNQQRGVKA